MAWTSVYWLKTDHTISNQSNGGSIPDTSKISGFVNLWFDYNGDTTNRNIVRVQVCIEALALDSSASTAVNDLISAWSLGNTEVDNFATAIGLTLTKSGQTYTASKSGVTATTGTGSTRLAALRDLCVKLGYVGGSNYKGSFETLFRAMK